MNITNNPTEKELTGYPSIDKPWLSKYSSLNCVGRTRYKSIYDNLRTVWLDASEKTMINYYDTRIQPKDFFARISQIEGALCAIGVKAGDCIAISLESVPEFLELLLACEHLGISIKNQVPSTGVDLELVKSCTSDIFISHDYISQNEIDFIYNNTHIEHIILVDPLFSVKNKDGVKKHILSAIQERYTCTITTDNRNISWGDFLLMGKTALDLPFMENNGDTLFSAFTSGTSGKPKEVLHNSESLLGVISQLSLFPSQECGADTWLLTILPPTLVAIVVSMMLYPLADGKQLILDPFCKLEDLDLEMMHYEPNCWGLIPLFFNTLLESKRIPDEYDMSYFKLFGFGAEPMTKKFVSRVAEFLEKHNCHAPFSSGYGQSEGGSTFTTCIGREMIESGAAGIPLIDTTISIFQLGTTKELKYGEVGEVCKLGPGIMVGYSDKEKTRDVLKKHEDGQIWLHTGDYGFMTSDGLLYVLGRKGIHIYPDDIIFPSVIENKITAYPGIKHAIVVPGKDHTHIDFQVPYLFIILENGQNQEAVLAGVRSYVEDVLSPSEKPKEIFVINKIPISHFKTDKLYLQRKFNL